MSDTASRWAYVKATIVMLGLFAWCALAWILPNGFAIVFGGTCLLIACVLLFSMLVEGFSNGFDFDD